MLYQFKKDDDNSQSVQNSQNNGTGSLISNMEQLSGYSLSDVNIHENSQEPQKVGALAYAQGTDVHLGPGQQEHLGHELAHVVQQKQGKVTPTIQMKGGIAINDDQNLEKEADLMGGKAESMQMKTEEEEPLQMKTLEDEPLQMVGETTTWTPPFEGSTPIRTNGEFLLAMLRLSEDMSQLRASLPAGASAPNFTEMQTELQGWVGAFRSESASANVSSFYLTQLNNSFNSDYRSAYLEGLTMVKSNMIAQIAPLQRSRIIEPLSEENMNTLRAAFSSSDESTLSKISSLIETISSYNTKVNMLSSFIGTIRSAINGASRLERLTSITEGFGTILEKAGQVVTALRVISGVIHSTNGATTASMQAIDNLETGFRAIDLTMTFAQGVPILGQLWSGYYMPAIELCLTGIRRIADLSSQQAHQLVELNIQTGGRNRENAPQLGPDAQHFQGGQAVLDFMWQVMRENPVTPSQEVHDYFIDHQNLFEAGAGDSMTVTGNGLTDFWQDNRVQGLYSWASVHKQRIWGMLYGTRLSPPR
jgi:hypothetical protein